ncbi:MAG: hypothetical protein CMC00_05675 [Flavobacteriaceae bacterium]|nr:hypothetical protein [Flavobacteriaceae bacterium]
MMLMSQSYFGLSVDNDLYFGTDRYYSSGIFLKYGRLKKKPKDSVDSQVYVSEHWTFGQEINTPSLRLTSDLNKIDYPYSGWLYLSFQKEYFQNLDFGYGWGLQIGTSGAEASLAKYFQNNYHIYILNLEPLSWAYSIPQSFLVNFDASALWGKQLNKKLKWVQENRIFVGSFRTNFSGRFGIQWGNLPGLPFFGQRLEDLSKGFALFAGTKFTLNFHDYSLTGSLFESNTSYNLKAKFFRKTLQGGLAYFRSGWRGQLMLNYTSAFITTQRINNHLYLNISLNKFF